MAVVIEINGRRRTLFACADGTFGRRLAMKKGGPYVYADVGVVHTHGCHAVTLGRRHGPCNCGAEELLRKVLSA